MAWAWVTSNGRRKSTSAPSRTPRPLNVTGSTWAMATTGKNAISTLRPMLMPSASAAAHAASTTVNWYTKPVASTPHRGGGTVAEAVDTQVNCAEEAQPARIVGVAPEQQRMGGDEHDAGEQHERARRQAEGELGGAALVQQRGLQRQCDQAHHRQDDPPAEALEHDRREGRRRLTVLRGQARDTQHVAPDRRGQEVRDEQAREVVPEQRRQPGGDLEAWRVPVASAASRARRRRR